MDQSENTAFCGAMQQSKPWKTTVNSYLPAQNSVSKKTNAELQGGESSWYCPSETTGKKYAYSPHSDNSFIKERGLNRRQISELLTGTYLNKRQNILITRPTGQGKIHLACALKNRHYSQQISVHHSRLSHCCDTTDIYMHIDRILEFLFQMMKFDDDDDNYDQIIVAKTILINHGN